MAMNSCSSRSGITLIEVILTVAIGSAVMVVTSGLLWHSTRFFKQSQVHQTLQAESNQANMTIQNLLNRADARTLVVCSCGTAACSNSCTPPAGTTPNSRIEFSTLDTRTGAVIFQSGDALYVAERGQVPHVLLEHHVLGFNVTGDGQDMHRVYYTLNLGALDFDQKPVTVLLPNQAALLHDGTFFLAAGPPPPPPACVPNGTCTGTAPACGTTGPGIDNCGGSCTLTGPVCPPPPPACVPNGSCAGAIPACGTTGPGADNCGNACTITGPVCPCVPSGVCSGAPPVCGTTGPGVDNCGNSCTLTAPACRSCYFETDTNCGQTGYTAGSPPYVVCGTNSSSSSYQTSCTPTASCSAVFVGPASDNYACLPGTVVTCARVTSPSCP